MFRGISKVSLDAKGRFAIPTRFRAPIQAESDGRLVITIETVDPCLLLFTLPDWSTFEKALSRLPTLNPNVRRMQRMMIGHADDVDMDGQGRVLIPPMHRELVGLDKKIVLTGQRGRFEIWSDTTWSESLEGWRQAETDLRQSGEADPVLGELTY